MLFRVTSAISCGGLLLFATAAYAIQGDPLPGIDVSMEQNPGGIIIAQTTTNGTGELGVEVKPGTYRAVIRLTSPSVTTQPKTADIALTIKSRARPDQVIRVGAAWRSDTSIGIDFNTTVLSTVAMLIVEGKPGGAAPATTAAPACTWASSAYSQGAVFCMGPDTAIECAKPPEWIAKKSEACGKAAPVVPR